MNSDVKWNLHIFTGDLFELFMEFMWILRLRFTIDGKIKDIKTINYTNNFVQFYDYLK